MKNNLDKAYLKLLDKLLSEWNSEEDSTAYKYLQKEKMNSTNNSKKNTITDALPD